MSTKLVWQDLKSLVTFDQELHVFEKEVTTSENAIKNNLQLIKKLSDSLHTSHERCKQKQKEVDLAELQAEELKQQEDAKKSVLEKTANAKEYKGITKELRAITSQIIEQEDFLINAWQQLEQAQKQYEAEKSAQETKVLELQKEIKILEEKITSLKNSITAKQQDRITLTQQIPPETLQQYERMKNQVEDPIVPVVQNSCSSCFYNILFHDLGKLKKSDLVHCKNCYRFLYYDEAENQGSNATTF